MIQSNNPFYPIVMPPKSLMDIKSDGHSLLAWLEPTTEKLVSKMENKNFSGILIGPEGGFSKQEHAYIRDNYSFQTISGPIMRADTCVAFGVGFLNGLC
jgi:RsmE family RNA methyltransferase